MPLALAAALPLSAHPFPSLPAAATHEVLGVRYAHVCTNEGDDLYVTERGWPWLTALLPESWYRSGYYKKSGTRLRFSTGAVYRVPVMQPRRIELVVKFSRLGQYLDAGHLGESHTTETNDDPSFLSPFEEIAALEQLRSAPGFPSILTKRALGIFSPRERYRDWQLGRIPHHFERHAQRVVEGQAASTSGPAMTLDSTRSYVTLFHWMHGLNLEECVERGLLDRESAESINRMVLDDLSARGFKVLDHKPNHVIVCFTRRGTLLRRHGRVVYGLADFELLQRLTPVPEVQAAKSVNAESPLPRNQGPREAPSDKALIAT